MYVTIIVQVIHYLCQSGARLEIIIYKQVGWATNSFSYPHPHSDNHAFEFLDKRQKGSV